MYRDEPTPVPLAYIYNVPINLLTFINLKKFWLIFGYSEDSTARVIPLGRALNVCAEWKLQGFRF